MVFAERPMTRIRLDASTAESLELRTLRSYTRRCSSGKQHSAIVSTARCYET
jgi:hypothetical protein